MKTPQERSADPATVDMLAHAAAEKLPVAWDRLEAMEPQCGFGMLGICCRNCTMGPCRIDPFGDGPSAGVCGADAEIIAARNLVRMIAAGAAAHSDHGRDIAHTLLMAAKDENCDYKIKDKTKLYALAKELGVETEGKQLREIALSVGELVMAQFGRQHGEVVFAARAPQDQINRWRQAGVMPRGVDREIVEIMHRTHIGVDNDANNIISQGVRASLSDGWGGSMIATDISDVLFHTPEWIRSRSNLGVLDADAVNIIVHGHEPTLSEMIVAAVQDKEMIELAKSKGASGINLSGICCTANEILMRHGIPLAGNFLQQELAVATGVVDAIIVDVQCIMPSLGPLVQKFHTKFISTSPKAKFPYAEHIEFEEAKAFDIARRIVREAIENFPNRNTTPHVPKETSPLVAGFTPENVFAALGGRYRPSYRPLNDAIISGRLRGVAGVVGCNNPKQKHDYCHLAMTKELIANDVLVAMTGCSAVAAAKAGLMTPESAEEHAGKGLQEICRAVGIPPVLHVGSCVDNSRILMVLANMVAEGGLGESIADLPAAGAAPEWMSEKAVSIGFYVMASGVYTVLAEPLPIQGAPKLTKFLCGEGIEDLFGGKFAFEADPIKAARMMIDHIDAKRAALHLPGPMYEAPYAPQTAEEALQTAN